MRQFAKRRKKNLTRSFFSHAANGFWKLFCKAHTILSIKIAIKLYHCIKDTVETLDILDEQ